MIKSIFFGAISAVTLCWVSFNIGFDNGADTALCVVQALHEGQKKHEVEACSRASIVETYPFQKTRQLWLWLHDDEVNT